jgi:hypothetical protein
MESGDSDTDTSTRDSHDDEDSEDLNMSLAAMEDAVRDDVMALFDEIATAFKPSPKVRIAALPAWQKAKRWCQKAKSRIWNLKIKLVRIDGRCDFQHWPDRSSV